MGSHWSGRLSLNHKMQEMIKKTQKKSSRKALKIWRILFGAWCNFIFMQWSFLYLLRITLLIFFISWIFLWKKRKEKDVRLLYNPLSSKELCWWNDFLFIWSLLYIMSYWKNNPDLLVVLGFFYSLWIFIIISAITNKSINIWNSILNH